MTSKKLSSKRIFAVCKTQLYQMRLLFVLFGLGLAVLPTLITWGNFANGAYDFTGEVNSIGTKSVISGAILACGFALMFGLSMAMAVMQFGYLHKRQKLDYFHAIPILRAEHFLGRVLAAFTVLVSAAVLIVLGQIFSLSVTIGFHTVDGLGKFVFWRSFWIIWPSLSAYLFTALMIILTATLWETIFSLLAVSALSPAVIMCAYVLVINSRPIHDAVLDWAWIAAFSPLIQSILFVAEVGLVQMQLLLTRTIVVTLIHLIVCGGLAMWFFCRRRSELAESNMATRFKLLVRFSAAFCAAALGSVILLFVTEKYFAYWVGAVIGIVIAWLIMELLYTRSLKNVKKSLAVNLLGFMLFIGINILVLFGFIGVPNVPNAEDVYAVSVRYGKETMETTGDETASYYESFNGDSRIIYTDENRYHISMGTSEEAQIEAGVALAKAMLENQKDRYYPYTPMLWGGFNRYGVTYDTEDSTDALISYDVTLELYTEGKVKTFSFSDFGGNGRIEELFASAEEIAESEGYRESCPTLALLENLNRVEFMNYTASAEEEIYKLPDNEESRAFIRRLQEAYAEDLYALIKGGDYEYSEGEYAVTEEVGASTEMIPIELSDEYVLFIDPSKEILFRGGILDSGYTAEGLHAWPSPEYTKYKVEENYWTTSTTVYVHRMDHPRTCAVLDELRTEKVTE